MNNNLEIVNEKSVHKLLQNFKEFKDRSANLSPINDYGMENLILFENLVANESSFGKAYIQSVTWLNRLEELYEFKSEHGHCNVPQRPSQLGKWVQRQRTQYKYMLKGVPSQMTKERIELLESIGFNWSLKRRKNLIEQNKREVRRNEQKAIEASCDESQTKATSKKNEMKNSTNELFTEKDSLISRTSSDSEKKESTDKCRNGQIAVKEIQIESTKEVKIQKPQCASLQEKIQILCKLSLMFREEKDAVYADIKKRKLDNDAHLNVSKGKAT